MSVKKGLKWSGAVMSLIFLTAHQSVSSVKNNFNQAQCAVEQRGLSENICDGSNLFYDGRAKGSVLFDAWLDKNNPRQSSINGGRASGKHIQADSSRSIVGPQEIKGRSTDPSTRPVYRPELWTKHGGSGGLPISPWHKIGPPSDPVGPGPWFKMGPWHKIGPPSDPVGPGPWNKITGPWFKMGSWNKMSGPGPWFKMGPWHKIGPPSDPVGPGPWNKITGPWFKMGSWKPWKPTDYDGKSSILDRLRRQPHWVKLSPSGDIEFGPGKRKTYCGPLLDSRHGQNDKNKPMLRAKFSTQALFLTANGTNR